MGEMFKILKEEGDKVTIENTATGEVDVIDRSQIVSEDSENIGVANAKMFLADEENDE